MGKLTAAPTTNTARQIDTMWVLLGVSAAGILAMRLMVSLAPCKRQWRIGSGIERNGLQGDRVADGASVNWFTDPVVAGANPADLASLMLLRRKVTVTLPFGRCRARRIRFRSDHRG